MKYARKTVLPFVASVAILSVGAAPAMAEQRSDVHEALKALKALQAVTLERITMDDYAQRVRDAQARVARYLSEPERGDAELRTAVRDAIGLYLLVLAAWQAKVTNRFEDALAVGRDPMLDRCPFLQGALARYPLGRTRDQDFARGLVATLQLPTVWSCASDKTEEAEELLQGKG